MKNTNNQLSTSICDSPLINTPPPTHTHISQEFSSRALSSCTPMALSQDDLDSLHCTVPNLWHEHYAEIQILDNPLEHFLPLSDTQLLIGGDTVAL